MMSEDELREIIRGIEEGNVLTPAEAKAALEGAARLIWLAAVDLEQRGRLPRRGLDRDNHSDVVDVLAEICAEHIQQQLMGLRKSHPDKDKGERSGWRLDTDLAAFVGSRYRGVLSNWRRHQGKAPIEPIPRGQSGEADSDVIDRLSREVVGSVAASWSPEQRVVDRDLIDKAIVVLGDSTRISQARALAFGLAKGLHGEATSPQAIQAYAKKMGTTIPAARIKRASLKTSKDGVGLDLNSVAALLDVTHESIRSRVRGTEANMRALLG